jgi:hypothetical protein
MDEIFDVRTTNHATKPNISQKTLLASIVKT